MNLTREQAIERCGLAAVESVERENCEPTNTVGYNGRSAGDALSEWSATVDAVDTADGLGCKLTAYYYIGHADEQAIEDADGDGGVANWVIDHYAIN